MKILDGSVGKLEAMEASFAEIFPYSTLSAASRDFASVDVTKATNEKVLKAVSMTLDSIYSVSQDVLSFETFLHLHIPKMEDGNNFGVSVQLAMLKLFSDLQEATSSRVDDLSSYASARADALEKLKLTSTSSTVTKSSANTTTDGKKEEKTTELTEEKKSSSDCTGPAYESRVAALVALDSLYYSKAQRAFQTVMTLYMAALDFMDKNKEKLVLPKGSGGSHSGFHSMY
jgi:hypothetical protein